MNRFALIALGLCAALPVAAQDIVGFDRGSFGRVVLNQNQSAVPDFEFEASIGNYNNESIQNYSSDSVFARMGRAVGRLDILTDAGIFPCTAFIVDDKHLLTNYHCVPGILDNAQAGASRIEAVQFVAGYTQQGVEEGTRKYVVNPVPVEAHQDLDYALLEVIGNPSSDFGVLKLHAREARGGDPYWVIGHPMGEAQRISREQCRANVPPLSGTELLHTCDTLPGNSGSPIIDASLQMVVALHHAGSKKDSVNFGIPMALILERSSYLTAALDAPGTSPRPGSEPTTTDAPVAPPETASNEFALCDQLYTEAKTYAACFAYRAYAQQCDGHPFVGFARAYMDENCEASGSDPVDTVTATPPPVTTPTVPTAPAGPLRPWCTSTNLNPTEATICGDPYLAGLDKDLDTAYSASWKHGPTQVSWLRNTRDACSTDRTCIARAVIERISVLEQEAREKAGQSAGSGQDYELYDGRCYITVASRRTLAETQSFIRQSLRDTGKVRVFKSNNGFFGITYGIVTRGESDWTLAQWKAQGLIPSDSYCSTGENFVSEVSWSSIAAPPPAPTGGVKYVDNNSDGGLNVRTGPNTTYPYFTELDPGTVVEILTRQGSWAQVSFLGGSTGWVYEPLLTSSRPVVQQCKAVVVNLRTRAEYNSATGAGFLSVRSAPSTATGRKLSELYLGDTVRVLAQRNGWARVYCIRGGCTQPYFGEAGARGWASSRYLSISCS